MEIPKEEGFVTVVEGNLLKKILKEGQGSSPAKGQEVTAFYKGTLTDGTVFDSNQDPDSPFKFTLGVGQVIKGWDSGFASMKKGEKAILVCSPEFAYGKNGSGKIPGNATLHFEVELIDFQDKKREKHELSDTEKFEEAVKLKDKGNDLFKTGKNKEAATDYTEVVSLLEDIDTEEATKLRQVARLNAAMAYIRTKQYPKAIVYTTEVLNKDPNNSKALFRRGVAHLELQDFTKSKADLDLLSKNEPDNADVKKELVKLRAAQAEARKKEKKVFGKIFASNYYEDMKPEQKKEDPADYKKMESSSDEEGKAPKEDEVKEATEVKESTTEPAKIEVEEPKVAEKIEVEDK